VETYGLSYHVAAMEMSQPPNCRHMQHHAGAHH